MTFIDPTNFEFAYYAADFLMGGLQTFLIEPAWTFSVWFDSAMESIFGGISGSD